MWQNREKRKKIQDDRGRGKIGWKMGNKVGERGKREDCKGEYGIKSKKRPEKKRVVYSKRDCKKRCAKRETEVERVRLRRDERREMRRRKMIYNAGKIDREGRTMRTESAIQEKFIKERK